MRFCYFHCSPIWQCSLQHKPTQNKWRELPKNNFLPESFPQIEKKVSTVKYYDKVKEYMYGWVWLETRHRLWKRIHLVNILASVISHMRSQDLKFYFRGEWIINELCKLGSLSKFNIGLFSSNICRRKEDNYLVLLKDLNVKNSKLVPFLCT